MQDPLTGLESQFFRALANPVRLQIIHFIGKEEICQCDIIPAIGKAQSTISQHLELLVRSGILANRQDGSRTLYKIADSRVFGILKSVRKLVLQQIGRLTQSAQDLKIS
ncbi:MAG: ArsR/SmtB family transcription factor [Candidatus Ranarchaeia archaeon]|jgi:ArsR family transcriptional regulator